jgi:hypothetical protein
MSWSTIMGDSSFYMSDQKINRVVVIKGGDCSLEIKVLRIIGDAKATRTVELEASLKGSDESLQVQLGYSDPAASLPLGITVVLNNYRVRHGTRTRMPLIYEFPAAMEARIVPVSS